MTFDVSTSAVLDTSRKLESPPKPSGALNHEYELLDTSKNFLTHEDKIFWTRQLFLTGTFFARLVQIFLAS